MNYTLRLVDNWLAHKTDNLKILWTEAMFNRYPYVLVRY